MKKGDIALLIILGLSILGCIAFFMLKPKAADCVVYENGKEIYRFSLDKDLTQVITTEDGHYNTLEIKDGRADITSADCSNQICVHTSPAEKVGDSIICLPHKLSVILESK
ncbi:MAG: NusG domain II-containing protein [Lachnospiraceae bacterium]|nr:NusG domain II-containing protein [Lachnospiraceae bacterium]